MVLVFYKEYNVIDIAASHAEPTQLLYDLGHGANHVSYGPSDVDGCGVCVGYIYCIRCFFYNFFIVKIYCNLYLQFFLLLIQLILAHTFISYCKMTTLLHENFWVG